MPVTDRDNVNVPTKFQAPQGFQGPIIWKSPANIALIKYWGKKGHQLPCNPSLSMTLRESCTITALSWRDNPGKGPQVKFTFAGKSEEKWVKRIEKYLQTILPHMPALSDLDLAIESQNLFPHSAGMASSASAFSALALCLCSLD
ncbi:MAG: diphosphomevalonate decarboxylase, partial [Pseudomonadota bacterium]